jgi:hypothetical protein
VIHSIEKASIDRYEINLTRWLENAPQDRTLREDTLSEGISLLKGAVAALGDHDAIGLPLDDPQTRRLRTICRETWMDLRKYFGTAFDDYLDKDIPDRVILRALLRVQGPQADGSMMGFNPERVWDLDNVVPLEYRDVVDLYGDYKRANQIESSPPRSPPRNGSEEQQGWWDYWEEHPESGEYPARPLFQLPRSIALTSSQTTKGCLSSSPKQQRKMQSDCKSTLTVLRTRPLPLRAKPGRPHRFQLQLTVR